MDFTGPFENQMILVLIESHSKWIQEFRTFTATSKVMISKHCYVFAQFGVRETIVSDNGTCFVNEELKII